LPGKVRKLLEGFGDEKTKAGGEGGLRGMEPEETIGFGVQIARQKLRSARIAHPDQVSSRSGPKSPVRRRDEGPEGEKAVFKQEPVADRKKRFCK